MYRARSKKKMCSIVINKNLSFGRKSRRIFKTKICQITAILYMEVHLNQYLYAVVSQVLHTLIASYKLGTPLCIELFHTHLCSCHTNCTLLFLSKLRTLYSCQIICNDVHIQLYLLLVGLGWPMPLVSCYLILTYTECDLVYTANILKIRSKMK